jgi:hypothetical protein
MPNPGALPRPSLAHGRPSEIRTGGPSIATILGGGCALVVVLGGIVVLIVHLITGEGLLAADPPLKVEVHDLRAYRGHAGNLTLIGELQNMSSAPIEAPVARATLYDARRAALGIASCAPPIQVLGPREKVPCAFSFGAVATYAAMDLSAPARPAPAGSQPASLAVTGTRLRQVGALAVLDGIVRNTGSFAARRVVLLVSLYGADNKIVGQAYVDARDLAPGESAPFNASVAEMAAAPQTFAVRAFGYR